jgi:hypothetical protein
MRALLATFRSLARESRRRPGFPLVVAITLGVGLGVTAAIFAVVDAVLIRPLPYPEADRLVIAMHDAPGLQVGGLIGDRADIESERMSVNVASLRDEIVGDVERILWVLLVIAQMALAVVLLIGSGLMVKSFRHLRNVDPGFDPRGVLTLRLDLPSGSYPDAAAIVRFTERLLPQMTALPAVMSAATVRPLPLTGGEVTAVYEMEDFPRAPGQSPQAFSITYVTPGYFRTLGIPVQGRVFDIPVAPSGEQEVLVSHSLAERYWKGRSALGRRLGGRTKQASLWYRIVGIAGDVHGRDLVEPLEAIRYE